MSDLEEVRTESYLVRFWHSSPDGPWRVRLTNVRTGWTRYFDRPEELWACLRAEIGHHTTQMESPVKSRFPMKESK